MSSALASSGQGLAATAHANIMESIEPNRGVCHAAARVDQEIPGKAQFRGASHYYAQGSAAGDPGLVLGGERPDSDQHGEEPGQTSQPAGEPARGPRHRRPGEPLPVRADPGK